MAPLRATKRGKTRSRQEQAQANVRLAKRHGYERGALAQRVNRAEDNVGHAGHDFDPHVVDTQDSILRIYLE